MGKPSDIIVDESIWIRIPERLNGPARELRDGNGVMMALIGLGIDHEPRSRLGDETAVRLYWRDYFAREGTGMVQCNLSEIYGQKCVKTIGKKMVPGKPGFYIASRSIPLAEESFVVILHAQEIGTTGLRDTGIFLRMRAEARDLS